MRKWIAAAALALCMAATGVSVSASGASAVFDFGDNAFFTVRMQENESVYLSLDTEYDRQLAQTVWEETGLEADRFYQFDTGEEGFLRTGELFLQADENQQVYEIAEDGSIDEVEAQYAHGYTIGKDGERISGYVIRTRNLGRYVVVG